MGLREKTWAAAAAVDEGKKAKDLLAFLTKQKLEECRPFLASYDKFSDKELEEAASADLKSLLASREFTGLAEVHPGWILEAVRGEHPRVVGVILRYLPSHHVKYVLEQTDPEQRNKLPAPLDAFKVKPQIVSIIRDFFQKRFVPMFLPKKHGPLGFEDLPHLKEADLYRFFEMRGLIELSLALHGMPVAAKKVVLNRLSLAEAKKLEEYLREVAPKNEELVRAARSSVLCVESDGSGRQNFLRMLGLRAAARASVECDENWIALVKQRMPPSYGYLWQRCVDEAKSDCLPFSEKERGLARAVLLEMTGKDSKGSPDFGEN